ncbi:cyclin-T1-like isoform X2 [Pristis pectinata]|uniref:cyclin-T1-like isoform X2 n=1 Tax=Pristis pectinata TaxID=685728 RepID=UPI00223DB599|nr:cyclin-T1-like isoform X2 [Pristis pectinata]
MAAASSSSAPGGRWCFSRQQLQDSPSRRGGVDWDRELSYRQQAANLVQDMGQRLSVSQLTINTAIVYMHRFYMQQCFTKFHRNTIAPAALFLAAKVEEQPRKLEHVIKVAHACLNPQEPPPDIKSEAYLQEAQDLVILESVILQTLGFEITIDHPHTHVVKCTQLVRASKDLAQTSYFMATNSLHLTTFCLQYQPPVVACVCIHLACKWSNWEIPVSTDGKNWWEYVDPTVTLELLDELTHEFLQILEKTPNRLKRIKNWRACQAAKKPRLEDLDSEEVSGGTAPSLSEAAGSEDGTAPRRGGPRAPPPSGPLPQRVSLTEYRAKRAEELQRQRPPPPAPPPPPLPPLPEPRDRRPRPETIPAGPPPPPSRLRPPPAEEGEAEEEGGGRRGSRDRRRDGAHRHRRHHWGRRGGGVEEEGEEGAGGGGSKRRQPRPLKAPPGPPPASSRPPEANGHSHYQDAFEMLESLLSAQGVPRAPPHTPGDFRRPRGESRPGPHPPPLPAEPPPPLPPLPK